MVRLNRWWYALVILVVLGAVFVDGFGDLYQAFASGNSDPALGCSSDLSLRGENLSAASGTYSIQGIAPTGHGEELAAGPWSYNQTQGNAQQIGTSIAQTLADNAAGSGDTQTSRGFHFRASLANGPSHTFWLKCSSVGPTVPSATASASPSATSTSAPGTASPKPTASATPKPTTTAAPTTSASASTSPTAKAKPKTTTKNTITGTLWVDSVGAPSILGWNWPFSLHKGLDLVGGTELTIVICHGPNNPAGSTCREGLGNQPNTAYTAAQSETLPIIQQRVNSLGVAEATVEPQDDDKIVVQIPGVGLLQAEQAVGTTAKLHFATLVSGAPSDTPGTKAYNDQEGLIDPSQVPDTQLYPTGYHWKIDPRLPASDVTAAAAVPDPTTGAPDVSISFNGPGAAEWNRITTAANAFCVPSSGTCTSGNPQDQIAIFLDNEIISAPSVVSPSSANTQITGLASSAAATQLASQINAGSLPADISTIASTEVSATLGAQTVKDSLIAGAVGLLAVILFMLFYYRFPGFLASLALVCYSLIALALFKMVPVTLSLAGLAGFVLSVGMAVDANVLIFERVRDELRHGQTTIIAVDTGFRRAFPAIRDSNLSTIIACGVLWAFGSGDVKGFALTLGIGVAVSFFSAVLITQSLLAAALHFKRGRNPQLYTRLRDLAPATTLSSGRARNRRFDIVTSRNTFFGISLAILIPGILAIIFWGFNLGLDFSGGNSVEAQLIHSTTQAQVLKTAEAVVGDLHPSVEQKSNNTFTVETQPSSIDRVQVLTQALQKQYGIATDSVGNQNIQVSTVGPTIAQGTVSSSIVLVLVAAALIALYLSIVFRGQRAISAWRFSICTFFKLLHDVFVLAGIWAILGHFSPLGQVSTLFITAVLTSVAFSIHDTIVVFDRIRENLRTGPRLTFDQTVNLSTLQTMTRSLNTALTVVFVLLSLVLFGGASIQGFVLALLIGIITGTYSSIFNASTMLVAWDALEHRVKAARQVAAAKNLRRAT